MNNIRTHYKSEFRVERTATADGKNIFETVVKQSRFWVKEHYKEPDQDYLYEGWFFKKGEYEVEDLSTKVKTVDYDVETGTAKSWDLRFEHNDENYTPRRWRVDVALTCIDDNAAELGVTVSWYLVRESSGEEPSEPDSAVPRLVKRILKNDGLACFKSGIKLSRYATQIQAGDERQFYESIVSQDRTIPIILINKQEYGEGISADGIQNLLAGSALVYWFDSTEIQTALNNEWGPDYVELYQCSADTIRIYLPGLDIEMDYDWERHPCFSLQEYEGRFQELSRKLKERIL